MATVWKKSLFLPCFLWSFKFLKNSKNQNFHIILVWTIEGYIKKVHAKFQVNRFIRTWEIMSNVLEKVVSRKMRLKIWEKLQAVFTHISLIGDSCSIHWTFLLFKYNFIQMQLLQSQLFSFGQLFRILYHCGPSDLTWQDRFARCITKIAITP